MGGHIDPSSIVGDSLVWKNAQENVTKNKTTETIDRIIPYRKPFVTIFVCSPWYVSSRVTSRHQSIIVHVERTGPRNTAECIVGR